MLNRSKTLHDKNWPTSSHYPAERIPWHDTESSPARRDRLTTLDALELIRRRFEATKNNAARHHAENGNHQAQDGRTIADHEQQAA